MKSIKELITFEIVITPETIEIEGNASAIDPKTDAEVCKLIQDRLEAGNEWAWCSVEVKGEYLGLTASDYLGACSYLSEDDFKTDGYYKDMQSEVADQIQEQYDKIKND